MSANFFNPIARGYNPSPLPGAESTIGWKTTADGSALLMYVAGGVAIPVTVQTPDLVLVRSDKDTDFTGGLGVGDMGQANLAGLGASSGRIESITLLATQNLAWDIALFTKDTFTNSDIDLDTYLASVRFAKGDGRQIASVGAYRYDAFGLGLPYKDVDATSELHVGLVNRGPGAKTSGAGGAVVVLIGFRADD